jgi:hypothetical protein
MAPGVFQLHDRIEAFATSHRRACALLALACLALFLPGFFSLQPMDRDEPRFAQATKQMLETGDYVSIRFQDEARNKKPVGIYWMQSLAVTGAQALGVDEPRARIWIYRLPSLAGAVAAVLLTYWAALAFMGRMGALLAALLFASTLVLGVEARLAKTDAVVAATVVAAMGALARVYLARGAPALSPQGGLAAWRLPAIFWTAIGIGVLVKGPITPMAPLLAFLALAVKDRAWRWAGALKPLAGLGWTLLLVAPWFTLIMIETDGAFLRDSLGKDMLGKVSAGQEAHGAPPLTYFAAFWATAWPLAPFAALAAPFVFAQRRAAEFAFLLAWLAPSWIIFELTPTKLPHYVLPLYPAIALLAALAIERAGDALQRGRLRFALYWLPAFPVIVAAAGAGGAIWLKEAPGLLFFFCAPIVLALAFVMARLVIWVRLRALAFAAPPLALALYAGVYGGVLTGPPMTAFALSPRLDAALARAQAAAPGCADLVPATTTYREPSLVFLTRTDLRMLDAEQAAVFLREAPCRVVLIEGRVEERFRAALGDGAGASVVERVRGINLNGGRKLDIGLYLRGAGS